MTATATAMFPLGTVLFPHAPLALHVFEERYRTLMRDCLAGDRSFGVVLIDRGHEVGGGDHRTDLGTVAEIVRAEETPDGRWALVAVGVRRILVTRWLEDAPYPRADVIDVDEPPFPDSARPLLVAAERSVRRSLALRAELDEPAAPLGVQLSQDPAAATWELASLAPLGALDRQRLLSVDDPGARLAELTALTDDACTVLAQRLAGF